MNPELFSLNRFLGFADIDMAQVSILIADDSPINCQLLAGLLEDRGYELTIAEDGEKTMAFLRSKPFDLLLLDILMPKMNGYQVLEQMKDDPDLRHIPVIMISSVGEIDSVIKCIKTGAEDYLQKPFNSVLLNARIGACLEKKRLRDQEQAHLARLKKEKEKSEFLLLNIFPKSIANRLKTGERKIADYFDNATVMFTDIIGFSRLAMQVSTSELVDFLNGVFSSFDELAAKHGLEKIKTIGDAYMVAGGIPVPVPDHTQRIADMALDIRKMIPRFVTKAGDPIAMRIGIASGPVQAGVIGTRKFSYDLWGDTVNTASRMENHCLPNQIQVTESVYELLKNDFVLEKRDQIIHVKGMGDMVTYFLIDRK